MSDDLTSAFLDTDYATSILCGLELGRSAKQLPPEGVSFLVAAGLEIEAKGRSERTKEAIRGVVDAELARILSIENERRAEEMAERERDNFTDVGGTYGRPGDFDGLYVYGGQRA